jgi:ArsR family transcriptional regulator
MKHALEVKQADSTEKPSCASLLKVLADETRLAVVEQLLSGSMHVGEINASLHVEQSLLSHHLRVLREAGLVTARRDGKQVLYALAKGVRVNRPTRRKGPLQNKKPGRAIDLGCCSICFD